MPKTHRSFGLSITYPDNWNVTEDLDQDRVVGFQLQSPGTAFLSVVELASTTAPEKAVSEVAATIASEYENVEIEPFTPQLLSSPDPLAEVKGRELYFYYLDLLIRAQLIAFRLPSEATILVQFQAEDSEFQSLQKVFEAMLLTLCQSAKA